MVTEYFHSHNLTSFGESSIDKYHNDLKSHGVNVKFIFRAAAATQDSKVIFGSTRKCHSGDRLLHGYDYIVEVAKPVWDELDINFRYAVMDHLLAYIDITVSKSGKVSKGIRKPDIYEFSEVFDRHGAYHADLRQFLDKYSQDLVKKEDKKRGRPAGAVDKNKTVEPDAAVGIAAVLPLLDFDVPEEQTVQDVVETMGSVPSQDITDELEDTTPPVDSSEERDTDFSEEQDIEEIADEDFNLVF